MERTSATERHQREVARIIAALNRHQASRAHHVRVDDVHNAAGCLDVHEPLEWCGQPSDRLLGKGYLPSILLSLLIPIVLVLLLTTSTAFFAHVTPIVLAGDSELLEPVQM